MSSTPSRPDRSTANRWFYSGATVLLLALVIIGFRFFYFHGTAYPDGHPLTPPIRTLVIAHAVLMTFWMLLAIFQPVLVASGNTKLHRQVGVIGTVAAAGLALLGWKIGIESARVAPPGMMFGPFTPKQFMAVPVLDIGLFVALVTVGIIKRNRPEIHRPMMFLATLSVVAAGISRIDAFNQLYYGTIFQMVFGDFLFTIVTGAVIVVAKRFVTKAWDRWLAIGFAALTLGFLFIAQFMGTAAWSRIADFLLSLGQG